MTGEGIKPPFVVGKLGSDGAWHVLMTVPLQPPVWEAAHEIPLDAEQAERLARQLLEYAALVREKLGLPAGAPYP